MQLKGSCHCQKVKFELETDLYYPFMICYCTICRETDGSAFGCNVKGALRNLKILAGQSAIKKYRGKSADRHFCSECGSPLFLTSEKWPDGCWPNAAAIDSPLPAPPEYYEIFLDDRVKWFRPELPGKKFQGYSDCSIDEFHERRELRPRK